MEISHALHGRLAVPVAAWALLLAAAVCAHVPPHLQVGSLSYVLKAVHASCICAVYALVGIPELAGVLPQAARGDIDTHVLTSAAVLGALILGCAVEGALLLSLFATAHLVEERVTQHAQGDLRCLWESVPAQANLITSDPNADAVEPGAASVTCVEAESVPIGSLVLIRAGEQVPMDGDVVSGTAMVSLERITGESLPVTKRPGDEVPAGGQAADGALVVRTHRIASDSTPARIARLTQQAQQKRPRVQAMLDRVSTRYSQAVLAATVAFMLSGPLFGAPLLGAGGSVYRAFAFLSAAAPCALLMSPLAYVTAIAACAQRGALVRGGLTLDALADCGGVAIDKTGTITTGVLRCTSVEPMENAAHALAMASAMETRVRHPVAQAVLERAQTWEDELPQVEIESFEAVQGRGVEATLTIHGERKNVRFGSTDFAHGLYNNGDNGLPEHVHVSSASDGHDAFGVNGNGLAMENDGGNDGQPDDARLISALVAVPVANESDINTTERRNEDRGAQQAVFSFSDSIKSASKEAMSELRSMNMQVWMLTGDDAGNAQAIGSRMGLSSENIYSNLTPLDKLKQVHILRDILPNGKRIAMVGDGINDAPALASADVGIAVTTTPSEAAAAAGDVLLLHRSVNGIGLLPGLIGTARQTRRIVLQNLVLAALSVVGTSVPALFGFFPLWMAVLLHEGTTLLVVANSLRILLPTASAKARKAMGLLTTALATGVASVMLASYKSNIISFLSFVVHRATDVIRSAWAGLLAGCLHTLTGPDHLAALAPLTIGRSRAKATLLGGLWGCGHNTGQILTGIGFLVLRDKLPYNQDFLANCSQAVVGFTLILIGGLGVKEAREAEREDEEAEEGAAAAQTSDILPNPTPSATYEGEEALGFTSREVQAEKPASASAIAPGAVPQQGDGKRFIWGTYVTGVVHGLQPDALLILLPALTLPKASALSYLGSFLLGTVAAMAAYTWFIGAGTERIARRSPFVARRISLLSSAIALTIGAILGVGAFFGHNPFE